jgi:hypothetical protein
MASTATSRGADRLEQERLAQLVEFLLSTICRRISDSRRSLAAAQHLQWIQPRRPSRRPPARGTKTAGKGPCRDHRSTESLQLRSRNEPSAQNDGRHAARVGDVCQRVRQSRTKLAFLPASTVPSSARRPVNSAFRVDACSASRGVMPARTDATSSSWRGGAPVEAGRSPSTTGGSRVWTPGRFSTSMAARSTLSFGKYTGALDAQRLQLGVTGNF